ncbi:MAG: ATP-binding cassette domain-containing protein [Planctomycetota bacterium]
MIHVDQLTKYYGDYPAINGVSFDVERGQIVGFLGHNGAGKSTTMRILAGYLTATSGTATIAGHDVFWDSIAVRQKIGYMPESCPLYLEMRVGEYLHFRAGIKGIYGRTRTSRIDYVLERCWLKDVNRQLIGTLSKGYRQRVGLADSLLANPPVLILDEPTAGLDPTQIRSTRTLIRELGAEHTILLSTHILSEVEMACDHVIIVHDGKVAKACSLRGLQDETSRQGCLVAVFDGFFEGETLRAIDGVAIRSGDNFDGTTTLRLETADPVAATREIYRRAVHHDWPLRELRPDRPTLEDVFVQLTGRT